MPLARDLYDHFVEVPASGRSLPSLPQLPRKQRAELGDPAPDRLVGQVEPALGQHLLDVTQA